MIGTILRRFRQTDRNLKCPQPRYQQNGAALIIVLLLVATLSVIAVGLTDQTILSAARLRNDNARTQLFWRAQGAEQLSVRLLRDALAARSDGVMSLDDPWAIQPFDLSALATTSQESGQIEFADAGRCFNLNSLYVDEEQTTREIEEDDVGRDTPDIIPVDEQRILEFATLLSTIGIAENDARQLAIIIRDWIDPDSDTGTGGAEDDRYLRLPVPYRTGNTLLSDETELRSMIGVDAVLMSIIAPFVCALPTNEPAIVNINMLRVEDAPILVAIFGERLALSDAELAIERRPLGGYDSVNSLLNQSFLSGSGVDATLATSRLSVSSTYLQGRMRLGFGNRILQTTMLLRVDDGGQLSFVSRHIGS